MFDADVLVVGGGPVGEMMLVQLGARGVSAIGFDKAEAIWPKPRAVHFDDESLRTFQALGLGDRVAAMCEPMGTYRMENEAGEILMSFPTEQLTGEGWMTSYMYHQPEIEALLRQQIAAMPSVSLETGADVVSIEQDDDGVTCIVESAAGERRTYRARYLVGCDGAPSFVRKSIGSEFEDLGGNDPWLIVDGLLLGESPVEGSMVLYGRYSRPMIWARMPGNRARLELKVLPTDVIDDVENPDLVAQMSNGILTADRFRIERSAVYVFRACIADKWREGRVFLAGDAAHLAPPLFGQGLCAGIRDTVNLAWKLEYVLSGSPAELLDTYETERSPHARGWVEQARNFAGVLATTDPQVAAGRDAHMKANPGGGAPQAPLLGPGLQTDSAPPIGARAIQPIEADGTRFDDRIGSRFAIVATTELLAGLPAATRDALAAAKERIVVVSESDQGFEQLVGSVEADALVIRPDRYILGVARNPAELAALCELVLGVAAPLAAEVG